MRLREELTLYPGGAAPDGSPTWTLHDPARNQFFRIGWNVFEILQRWHLADTAKIIAAVKKETTLEIDRQDVEAVATFLATNQLLQVTRREETARLVDTAAKARHSWGKALLHHYLFFRIPLARPDAWLERWLPYLRWIGTNAFRNVVLGMLALGLFLIGQQWDSFVHTLRDTFSWEGLASYAVALAGVKVLHELGHAFTAKHFGCRVPTMGVAFLVLWPVLYTDTTDIWKHPSRRARLAVGCAGVAAELTIAAFASVAWALLPDGPIRDAAFVLATTTWISSLLINLSPMMRFDGYFVLSDLLGMPNLHTRSFALARWRLRRTLFGLDDDPPEPLLPHVERGLVWFAFAVWIYRLVLFIGIAVLVYHFFIKAVGILLFAVEIGWFIVRPIMSEIEEWRRRSKDILATKRTRVTLAATTLVLLAALLPLQRSVNAPARFGPNEQYKLFIPADARIESIAVREGQQVQSREILFQLASPDLENKLRKLEGRIAVLQYQLEAAGFEDALRDASQLLRGELTTTIAEREGLLQQRERLIIRAPASGEVVDIMPNLSNGHWLGRNQRLATIHSREHRTIEAWVAENAVQRLRVGGSAVFYSETAGRARINGRITQIDPASTRVFNDPLLTSAAGGSIPVRTQEQQLLAERALYRVLIEADGDAPMTQILRGSAHLEASGESLLASTWRAVLAVLWRESGF
jgi:putative peptide zinc metalloprotease protein